MPLRNHPPAPALVDPRPDGYNPNPNIREASPKASSRPHKDKDVTSTTAVRHCGLSWFRSWLSKATEIGKNHLYTILCSVLLIIVTIFFRTLMPAIYGGCIALISGISSDDPDTSTQPAVKSAVDSISSATSNRSNSRRRRSLRRHCESAQRRERKAEEREALRLRRQAARGYLESLATISTVKSKLVRTRFLGSGSFGEVYLAYSMDDPSTEVAVKTACVDTDLIDKQYELAILDRISRCMQEGRKLHYVLTLANIDHPIWMSPEGWLHYAMNPCLTDLSSQLGKVHGRQLQKVVAELLCGISSIHDTLDTIHGDVKSENILIDRTGHCVFSDFSTSTTPNYIPPELQPAAGQSNGRTKAGDYWALGITIVELLAGPLEQLLEQRCPVIVDKGFYLSVDLSFLPILLGKEPPTLRSFLETVCTQHA
ncbi:hypothetical protein PLICRDRAFT_517546 [Plicaturopsis crispa FD-325 SS-3]|nr:hypothetical protein PLICRDRAFT_517546 [Plicaturopsis crispa FD-325 SS-3]